MGWRGISPGSILLILLLASLFFNGKRLKQIAKDVAEAFMQFKAQLNTPHKER